MRYAQLAILLLVTAAQAQARLQPVSPAEFKTLQPQLSLKFLPPRSESLHLEPRQSFTLTSPGAPALTLVPAWYDVPGTSSPGNIYSCGLFLAPAGGAVSFLPAYNLVPDSMGECASTVAIGLMDDPGPHPRILLVYNAYEPPRHSWQQPMVLTWDAHASSYQADPVLSPDGGEMPARLTIAQLRRQLRAKK